MSVAELSQSDFALHPINFLLFTRHTTSIADPLYIKVDGFFLLSLVWEYSTAELGRWFDITQFLQKATSSVSPYRVPKGFTFF